MSGLRLASSRCRKCRDRSANLIDSLLTRMSLTLISRLSPTTALRADAIPFRSSAVPRTMRRCIFRPSGPPSRHLKHQTAGPRLRRSTVTLPSCICLPPLCTTEPGSMLTGVINLRSSVASKAWLNVALQRQCSLRCDDCCFAILTCLPTNQTEMRRRATSVPNVFSLRSKPENFGQRPDNNTFCTY